MMDFFCFIQIISFAQTGLEWDSISSDVHGAPHTHAFPLAWVFKRSARHCDLFLCLPLLLCDYSRFTIFLWRMINDALRKEGGPMPWLALGTVALLCLAVILFLKRLFQQWLREYLLREHLKRHPHAILHRTPKRKSPRRSRAPTPFPNKSKTPIAPSASEPDEKKPTIPEAVLNFLLLLTNSAAQLLTSIVMIPTNWIDERWQAWNEARKAKQAAVPSKPEGTPLPHVPPAQRVKVETASPVEEPPPAHNLPASTAAETTNNRSNISSYHKNKKQKSSNEGIKAVKFSESTHYYYEKHAPPSSRRPPASSTGSVNPSSSTAPTPASGAATSMESSSSPPFRLPTPHKLSLPAMDASSARKRQLSPGSPSSEAVQTHFARAKRFKEQQQSSRFYWNSVDPVTAASTLQPSRPRMIINRPSPRRTAREKRLWEEINHLPEPRKQARSETSQPSGLATTNTPLAGVTFKFGARATSAATSSQNDGTTAATTPLAPTRFSFGQGKSTTTDSSNNTGGNPFVFGKKDVSNKPTSVTTNQPTVGNTSTSTATGSNSAAIPASAPPATNPPLFGAGNSNVSATSTTATYLPTRIDNLNVSAPATSQPSFNFGNSNATAPGAVAQSTQPTAGFGTSNVAAPANFTPTTNSNSSSNSTTPAPVSTQSTFGFGGSGAAAPGTNPSSSGFGSKLNDPVPSNSTPVYTAQVISGFSAPPDAFAFY